MRSRPPRRGARDERRQGGNHRNQRDQSERPEEGNCDHECERTGHTARVERAVSLAPVRTAKVFLPARRSVSMSRRLLTTSNAVARRPTGSRQYGEGGESAQDSGRPCRSPRRGRRTRRRRSPRTRVPIRPGPGRVEPTGREAGGTHDEQPRRRREGEYEAGHAATPKAQKEATFTSAERRCRLPRALRARLARRLSRVFRPRSHSRSSCRSGCRARR